MKDEKLYLREVASHYDLLIENGDDPVHDSDILREYMDRWDGQAFLTALNLRSGCDVLEIGVGTGRLAVRIAPRCRCLWGIDLSAKAISRAHENLVKLPNVKLIHGDFMTHDFESRFDVIYSSLTFMHIRRKQEAVGKIAELLKNGGRAVLSLDKSREPFIDVGFSRIEVWPDDPEEIAAAFRRNGLAAEVSETEAAYIVAAQKG